MKTFKLFFAGLFLLASPLLIEAKETPIKKDITVKNSNKFNNNKYFQLRELKRELRYFVNNGRLFKAEHIKDDILYVMKDDIRRTRRKINRLRNKLDNTRNNFHNNHGHHHHYNKNNHYRNNNRSKIRRQIRNLERIKDNKRRLYRQFKNLDLHCNHDRYRSVNLVNRYIQSMNRSNYNQHNHHRNHNNSNYPW